MAAKKVMLLSAAVAVVCVSLAVCAGPGTCAKSAEGQGIMLEYRMRPEQPLRYRTSSELVQRTEVAGSTSETTTTHWAVVTVRGVAADEPGSRTIVATIDSMRVHIVSSGGDLSPDTGGVLGKSFEMSLSPVGEESDFPDADTLQIDLGPHGKRSAVAMFQAMFPDLAGRAVAVGDTWTSRKSTTEGPKGQRISYEMETRHVLEGFEVLDGRECARMRSTLEGGLHGSGSGSQAKWTADGTLRGTSTWYFAAKEGFLVREHTETHGESVVTVERPGAEALVLPATSQTVVETTLVP